MIAKQSLARQNRSLFTDSSTLEFTLKRRLPCYFRAR